MGVMIGSTMHLKHNTFPCHPIQVLVDNPPTYNTIDGSVTVKGVLNTIVHSQVNAVACDNDTFATGTYHDSSVCPDTGA